MPGASNQERAKKTLATRYNAETEGKSHSFHIASGGVVFISTAASAFEKTAALSHISPASRGHKTPASSLSASEYGVFFYCGVQHHQIIRARNLPGAELFQVRGYPLSIEQ